MKHQGSCPERGIGGCKGPLLWTGDGKMRVGNSSLSEEVTQPVHLPLMQQQGPESRWKGWDQPHPDCQTSEAQGSQEEGRLPWDTQVQSGCSSGEKQV